MRGGFWGAGGSVQLQFSVAGVEVMAKDRDLEDRAGRNQVRKFL